MRVLAGQVATEAESSALRAWEREERLRVWDADGRLEEAERRSVVVEASTAESSSRAAFARWPQAPLAVFRAGERLASAPRAPSAPPSRAPSAPPSRAPSAPPSRAPAAREPEAPADEDRCTSPAERLKVLLMRALLCRDGTLRPALRAAIDGECRGADVVAPPAPPAPPAPSAPSAPPPASAPAVEYTVTETRIEAEALTFAAQGVIRTADGREIAFAVSMERAHLEVETSQVTVRVGTPPAPKDPLLLDLDGLARLTGESTPFDLDGDGVDDALPTLAGGAWLSFDVDADGVIRSRDELFGPASGDGFADLARLDDDGNGWIDEGDAAWSRLGLFDGAGFTALSDAGVGALSLTHADGDFTERVGGEAVARTRATGVYLTEAGAAGTIRQVDVLG